MFSQYDHLKGIDHSIGKTLNMKKYKHLFTISNYKLIETKCENAQKTFNGFHIVKITKKSQLYFTYMFTNKVVMFQSMPFYSIEKPLLYVTINKCNKLLLVRCFHH
jgi:hypothetical protein